MSEFKNIEDGFDYDEDRCPHDGGTCHHGCETDSDCFREAGGMALTEPYDGYPLPGHEIPENPLTLERLRLLNDWLKFKGDTRVFGYDDREWIHETVRALFDEYTNDLCVTCGSGEGEECTCANPPPIGAQ